METRLVQFIAGLRAAGVRISLAESQDAFYAVSHMGITRREQFATALRTTLVKEHDDQAIFDKLFPLYFGSSGPPFIPPEEALSPDETLADSDRFGNATEALGDDMTTSFYLDFLPILQLVESSGQAASDPDYQSAKPYLDALDFLAAGSKIDGDRALGSVVLGVREAEDDGDDAAAAAITP